MTFVTSVDLGTVNFAVFRTAVAGNGNQLLHKLIMKKKIRFSLVYRDMWQSTGKYQPRVDQLEAVAPHIIEMGCFDRIETNGGAFEQVQLSLRRESKQCSP
ncbi:MAG: hypothetical protein MZV63_05135 [Marinilabiliales bacterium]|nr:hypothetical protein [Marinilabiliales bacterium]